MSQRGTALLLQVQHALSLRQVLTFKGCSTPLMSLMFNVLTPDTILSLFNCLSFSLYAFMYFLG